MQEMVYIMAYFIIAYSLVSVNFNFYLYQVMYIYSTILKKYFLKK